MFKKGFTLAETLITLVIIGVVAALTVPIMIVRHQKEETVTRLKQSYSILSQALQNAEIDYGSMNSWEIPNSSWENSKNFAEKYMIPYLKVQKKCEKSSTECYPEKAYFLDGSNNNLYKSNTEKMYHFILINGTTVGFMVRGEKDIIELFLDINGKKKPNKTGKDIFNLVFVTQQANTYYGIHNNAGLYFYGQGQKRTELLKTGLYPCSRSGVYAGIFCGALIMLDGWKISDDYPW